MNETIKKNLLRIKATKKALKFIDFFGQPVRFHRDGSEYYTSAFGGLATGVVILFVILFFSSQIDSFRLRKQVTVQSETTYTDQQDAIKLEFPDFMFAIGIDQDNIGLTYRPYFRISAQLETSVNGNKSKVPPITLDLHPCTLDSFQILGYNDQQLLDLYELYQFETFLCPTNTSYQGLPLIGNQLTQDFTYVKISVNQCVNDSSVVSDIDAFVDLLGFYKNGNTSIPPCAPQEEIDDYFFKNQQFRLQIHTTNVVVNPQKPDKITTYFLTDDLNFYFQPKAQYKTVDVFCSKYEVTTDNSIFVGQNLEIIDYVTRQPYAFQVQSLAVQKIPANKTTQNSYFDVYFKRGNIDTKVRRTFVKVDALISQLGGFLSFMFLLFEFIVGKYNDLNLKINMVNNFYDSRKPDQDKDKQLNDVKEYMKNIGNNQSPQIIIEPNSEQQPLASVFTFKGKEEIQKPGPKTKREFLRFYYDKFIVHTSKVEITFKYLIYRIVYRQCLRNEKNLMIDKAVQKIQSDLDISKLINHYMELQKIKEIFLNKDQINLLNYIPRPKVYFVEEQDQEKQEQSKLKTIEKDDLQFETFLVVVNSFNNLMSSYHNKDIDLKSLNLIYHLGEDVRQIFLVSIDLYNENVKKKFEYNRSKSKNNLKEMVNSKLEKEIVKARKITKKFTLNFNPLDSSRNLVKSQIELEIPESGQIPIDAIINQESLPQLSLVSESVNEQEPPNQMINQLINYPNFRSLQLESPLQINDKSPFQLNKKPPEEQFEDI